VSSYLEPCGPFSAIKNSVKDGLEIKFKKVEQNRVIIPDPCVIQLLHKTTQHRFHHHRYKIVWLHVTYTESELEDRDHILEAAGLKFPTII